MNEQAQNDAFPLDFNSLHKDQDIDQGTIEKIYQVAWDKDPEVYRLRQLKLKEHIMDQRPDLLVRCRGRGLRIMTDHEAEQWTIKLHDDHVRGMLRNVRNRAAIDHGSFTEGERSASDHHTNAMAMTALSARRATLKAKRQASLLLAPKKPDA